MNYLPWVSNAVFGGADATERANYFVSWGIMGTLQVAIESGIVYKFKKLITHIPLLFNLTTKHIN